MRPRLHRLLLPAAALLVAAAGAAERPLIFVTLPPQRWLVREIAGGAVDVEVLVGPGQNPHTYEPTGRQMHALSRARVHMAIGLPFEQRILEKVRSARPELPQVRVDAGIARLAGHAHVHAEAECGEEGDPHVWLTPAGMAVMATNTAAALAAADPANRASYEAGLALATARIAATDARLQAILAPARGRTFMVHHPSWSYLAAAFGLRQETIEHEGRAPSARQLVGLVARAKQTGVRVIFTDPAFDPAPAEALARQVGARLVPIDPLAEDWSGNLVTVAGRIAEALTPPGAPP